MACSTLSVIQELPEEPPKKEKRPLMATGSIMNFETARNPVLLM
jgi:hypothetical protein